MIARRRRWKETLDEIVSRNAPGIPPFRTATAETPTTADKREPEQIEATQGSSSSRDRTQDEQQPPDDGDVDYQSLFDEHEGQEPSDRYEDWPQSTDKAVLELRNLRWWARACPIGRWPLIVSEYADKFTPISDGLWQEAQTLYGEFSGCTYQGVIKNRRFRICFPCDLLTGKDKNSRNFGFNNSKGQILISEKLHYMPTGWNDFHTVACIDANGLFCLPELRVQLLPKHPKPGEHKSEIIYSYEMGYGWPVTTFERL